MKKLKEIIKSFIIGYPIIIQGKGKVLNLNKLSLLKFGKIGYGVRLSEGMSIFNSNNIIIDDNVFIGRYAYIDATSTIKIGSGTMIGPNLTMIASNHKYDGTDLQAIPYDDRNELKPIVIEQNVWIGADVKILPGVTIGEGAVIGMGSVITKDVEPLSIVAGNPCRIIKYRNKEVYEKLKNEDKIFNKLYR